MKKLALIMMALALVLVSCGKDDSASSSSTSSSSSSSSSSKTKVAEKAPEPADDWKIGIFTGTVTQNEEEYRAAQNVLAKYGEDRVIVQTYPDKFMDEQETVIATLAGMAADPDLKALIICQAIPGTSAAIDKIRETREDILILAGTPGEDPAMIGSRADVVLQTDDLGMGKAIAEQAKAQGATTLVHYSFPRHMSYAMLAARRDLLKENAERIGLTFVDATAPDPTGDAGTSGTQQFILEDIPRMVAEYGENTSFFGTNCAMQPAMIKAVIDTGAIYSQPCCPSPTHGFPSAMELSIPEDKTGDFPWIIDELTSLTADADMTGRLSTWPVPISMMFIEAGAEYAVAWIEDGFDRMDNGQLDAAFSSYLDQFGGGSVSVSKYAENGEEFANYNLILSDFLTF